jgi:hypothetical protein
MLAFYPTATHVVNYSNTPSPLNVVRNWSLSFGERPVTICAYIEKRLAGYGMAASVDDERRVNKIGGQSVLRRIGLLLGLFFCRVSKPNIGVTAVPSMNSTPADRASGQGSCSCRRVMGHRKALMPLTWRG